MRRFAAKVAIGLVALPGMALARPDTTRMTCSQARALVVSSGAVVLGTGGPTYDRFVSDRRFCEATEVTRTTFAATRDAPRCLVGYRCIEPSRSDWFGDD